MQCLNNKNALIVNGDITIKGSIEYKDNRTVKITVGGNVDYVSIVDMVIAKIGNYTFLTNETIDIIVKKTNGVCGE